MREGPRAPVRARTFRGPVSPAAAAPPLLVQRSDRLGPDDHRRQHAGHRALRRARHRRRKPRLPRLERKQQDGAHDRRGLGHAALPLGEDRRGHVERAPRPIQGRTARMRLESGDLVRPRPSVSLEDDRRHRAPRRSGSLSRRPPRLAERGSSLPFALLGWGRVAARGARRGGRGGSRLRRGRRVAALGGSDTHYLHRRDPDPRHSQRLGTPTTWLRADRAVESILTSLREGRAFVSESARGPQLYLDRDPARTGWIAVEVRDGAGATLQLVGPEGTIAAAAVDAAAWDRTFAVPAHAPYVVAQLASPTGELRAIANPIWAEQL